MSFSKFDRVMQGDLSERRMSSANAATLYSLSPIQILLILGYSIQYMEDIKCLCGDVRLHKDSNGVSCLDHIAVSARAEKKFHICLYVQKGKKLVRDIAIRLV